MLDLINVIKFLKNFLNPVYLLKLAALGIAYYYFAKIGLSFAFGVKQVTLVWPPSGIAIASLVLFGVDLWPGILIGAFAANITTFEILPIAATIALGNTLESIIAYYLLSKVNFDKSFHHLTDILKYLFFGALVATLASATIGTAALGFGGTIGWDIFWPTWINWWLGDATGAMIFGPLILSWSNYKYLNFTFIRILKALVLVVSTFFVSVFAFTGYFSPVLANYPVRFVVFPLIIWAAIDYGVPGATWVTLVIGIVSVLGYKLPGSPFVMGRGDALGLIISQLYTAILGVTSLVLAAFTESGKRFEEDMELINSDLEKYRLAVKYASDHIIITDSNAHILYANNAATKITGYSQEEMLGKTPAVWGGRMPKKFYEKLWHTIKVEKKTFSAQVNNRRKNGEIYQAEIALTPILDKTGKPQFFVGIERDITEHVKLDQIRTDFVSMAAHELRGPLNNVRWYTESLEEIDLPPKTKAKEYLEQIYAATLKMTSLVNLLLNVSKVELGTMAERPEEVNVVLLASDVIKGFSPDIHQRNIKIISDFNPNSIEAFVDPNMVRIILENLLSNAIKYSPDAGTIWVSTTKKDGKVEIEVKDNGVGIPDAQKAMVFTKLFRADNVKKKFPEGTGLGLYLVKSIVDKLKGTISFESEEGKGTKFLVSLPITTNGERKEKNSTGS